MNFITFLKIIKHSSKKLEYVSALENNIGGFTKNQKKHNTKTHKIKNPPLEKLGGKVHKTVGFSAHKKTKTKKRRIY